MLSTPAAILQAHRAWIADRPKNLAVLAYVSMHPTRFERELIADYPDADMNEFPMHHVVPRLSGTPGEIRSPAPHLGEHNRTLLEEIGIDEKAYAELVNAGIVCASDQPAKDEQ